MAIQQRPSLTGRLQGVLNRVVSPQTRSQFYTNVSNFSQEQPLLASFIALQVLISSTPLFLFLSFAASTLLFSFITAILFSLFWIGLALLVLVPTLFVTVGLGIAVWVWAVSSFVVARWVYGLIPISLKGNLRVEGTNGEGIAGKKFVVDKQDGLADIRAGVVDAS